MRRGILTDVKVNYNLAVHIIESKVKKNISEYSHPFIFFNTCVYVCYFHWRPSLNIYTFFVKIQADELYNGDITIISQPLESNRLGLLLTGGEFHKVGLDEVVNISIHYASYV